MSTGSPNPLAESINLARARFSEQVLSFMAKVERGEDTTKDEGLVLSSHSSLLLLRRVLQEADAHDVRIPIE